MNLMMLYEWFHENHMALNPENCYYMVIGSKDPSHNIVLNNNEITSCNVKTTLALLVDSNLNFESHISSLFKKIDQQINALTRFKKYLTSDQKNVLLNSVINSQFTYHPLIWMFTSHYLK